MIFQRNSELIGKHALLSPSKYQGINDAMSHDDRALMRRWVSNYATEIGTILHDFASRRIDDYQKAKAYESALGTKVSKNTFKLSAAKNNVMLIVDELINNRIPVPIIFNLELDMVYANLMTYINDCIDYNMYTEQDLWYSKYCGGTCDAISFNENEHFLRIHDLKTGTTPAHMEQLLSYSALFCLKYGFNPKDIKSELRIYQGNEVLYHNPEAEEIQMYIDGIIYADKFYQGFKEVYK